MKCTKKCCPSQHNNFLQVAVHTHSEISQFLFFVQPCMHVTLLLGLSPVFIHFFKDQPKTGDQQHTFLGLKKSQYCGIHESRKRRIQTERRENRKNDEAGVWPTFHMCLCTVGQAKHTEQLESLCNNHLPPPPQTHMPFCDFSK